MTIESTRMIREEITNQMSRKLNEIKSRLYFQMQDAITAALAERVLPSIQNTLDTQWRANFTAVDRGSCGLQESPRTSTFTVVDRRCRGLQRNPEVENTQKTWENRPKTCFAQEHCRRMSRKSSVDFYVGEQNRDMVTGANLTPHRVPEFLTGRPMQSREPVHRQTSNNDESQDPVPPVQETTSQITPSDSINRLAEVLVGLNNRPSAQNPMVRPVSNTTLTFDGKSEKIQPFRRSLPQNDQNAT